MNSYFDQSDAEGQQIDHDDPCEICGLINCECIPFDGACCPHGKCTPREFCSECEYGYPDPREGNDMESTKSHPAPGDAPSEPFEFDWDTRLNLLLDEASDLQIKTAGYALERVKAKRLEAAHQRIRDLDPKAPRPRARRSDADKPRAPKAVKNP